MHPHYTLMHAVLSWAPICPVILSSLYLVISDTVVRIGDMQTDSFTNSPLQQSSAMALWRWYICQIVDLALGVAGYNM